MMSTVKTQAEIAALREGGRMLATVLELMREKSKVGMTPQEMSFLARIKIEELGGIPTCLGYHGFPDVICISVNDQVQHSIPTTRPFQLGDIVNYDFCVTYKGLVTDAGITVCIGDKTTPDTARLLRGTQKALEAGIGAVKAGCYVGDISAAIERVLRKHKLGIVHELVGHGVGNDMHEDPEIPNYGRAGTGPKLKAGMTIAIEPITTLGNPAIYEAKDGWTLLTVDGSWAAQFEHTVLVTNSGCEILTKL
ncbi:MAG TPA: type I methionyl aminopeptidase [Patescibacteria group bacterium]|nr:type I methionyl aminopeptidase [Patescibacteria group bacterium]